MKILKKTLTTLPLLLLLLTISLILPSRLKAAQFYFASYTLTQDETVMEDIYIVGEQIKIDGLVDGDLIAFGDTIQVNGTITGDTYLMASKVDVNANIYGSTFIFANNTSLEGLVTENTYIASTFFNYNADTQRDMFALFLEGTIKGSVGDDLRTVGMRSNIDTIVRGDLIVIADQDTVNEENITGEIYDSERLQKIAQAQGVDIDEPFNVEIPSFNFRPTWRTRMTTLFINFLSMLLVGFIIIMLSPVKTYQIQERITGSTNEFLKSLVAGFLISLVIPLPLFILLISVIGTPAAILIIGLLAFIMIFGKIWVETAFGREILILFKVNEYRPFKSFLVGRLLTILVNIIPIVRGFYNAILAFVALGAVVRMKRGYYIIANKEAKEFREKSRKSTKKKTTKKSSTKKTSKKK
jgi:hypothetical protein